WLRSAGTDLIYSNREHIARITDGGPGSPHTFTVDLIGSTGTVRSQEVTLSAQQVAIAPAADELVILDARDSTWARFRYNTPTLEMLPERLASIADPRTRCAIWLALRDSAEHAQLPPDYIVDT